MCDLSSTNSSNSSSSEFEFSNLTSLQCPEASYDELQLLLILSFFMEGVLQFIISSFGIFGNAIYIFLLTRKELHSFFNSLLLVLVINDILYLVTMLFDSISKLGMESFFHTLLFPYFLFPLNSISMTSSIYMTMAVAMERHIAVYNPIEYSITANDESSHNSRLAKYVVPITTFSVLFNLPKFFESKLMYREDDIFVEITELRMSDIYVTWYHNWSRFLVLGIIPFSVISVLNYRIYITVKKRRMNVRKNNDDNLSVVLVVIVFSFLMSNVLRISLNMHEITVIEEIQLCRCSELGGFPISIVVLGFISHILLVINSSVNLLIYCIFGVRFRQVLCSYLPWKNSQTGENLIQMSELKTTGTGD